MMSASIVKYDTKSCEVQIEMLLSFWYGGNAKRLYVSINRIDVSSEMGIGCHYFSCSIWHLAYRTVPLLDYARMYRTHLFFIRSKLPVQYTCDATCKSKTNPKKNPIFRSYYCWRFSSSSNLEEFVAAFTVP